MTVVEKYKKSIGITLLCFVIALHGFLRITEIPYAPLLLNYYIWVPALNVGAGKEFSDDSAYKQSPELFEFLHHQPLGVPKSTKLSFFDSFYDFTDYEIDNPRLDFPDSRGYRFIVGLAWKMLGFNWYHVGLINYLLSLIALLALIVCSYRTLGVAYSIAIGLIFALSPIEVYYVASFGRDGIPLWFACYLIAALILMFSKPLTLKRLVSYSIGMGLIIYASIEGRSSTTYFIPLLSAIYFILFYFYEDVNINSKYSYLLKNSFSKKTVYFSIATILTVFIPFSLQAVTNVFFPYWGAGANWESIFEGLGVWAGRIFHPSQLRYFDGGVFYFGEDYAQRIAKLTHTQTTSHITSKFGAVGDFIQPVYFSIAKTYPYFFWHDVVVTSVKNTLFYLGHENEIYQVFKDHFQHRGNFSYHLYLFGAYIFKDFYIFSLSIIGSILLYFRLNSRKMAIVLLSFMIFNASVSFLQFNMRHVLMGHPAYYFLSGITLAFLYQTYLKVFLVNAWNNTIKIDRNYILKLKRNLIFISPLIVFFVGIPAYKYLMNYLQAIEIKNVKNMQIYFDNLDKKPFDSTFNKKFVQLPDELLHKTIGIYCDLGEVITPENIHIKITDDDTHFYETKILPIVGKNVMLFFPFYYMNNKFIIQFNDNNKCKSFYWSDLKDWGGSLWEGTYDINTLKD